MGLFTTVELGIFEEGEGFISNAIVPFKIPANLSSVGANSVRVTVYNCGTPDSIFWLASYHPVVVLLLMGKSLAIIMCGYAFMILFMAFLFLINEQGLYVAASHGMCDYYRRFFQRARSHRTPALVHASVPNSLEKV